MEPTKDEVITTAGVSKLTLITKRKEAITYQSNCEAQLDIGCRDDSTAGIRGLAVNENTKIVIFDIETTGFSRSDDQIVQIAAKSDEKIFNVYIMPTCKFSPHASAVTGLVVRDGIMYKNSVPVPTVSPKNAINEFIAFLRSISPSIILAAHNGHTFDAPIILLLIQKVQLLAEFMAIVSGFADTLKIFKSKLLERRAKKKRFSQTALAEDYLGKEVTEGAHDAAIDVSVLQMLINNDTINISMSEFVDNTLSVTFILNAKQRKLNLKNAINSLQVLKKTDENCNDCKVGISANMISKIAKAGICLEHLQQIYSTSGIGGLTNLLSQNVGQKKGPRVTSNKKIINALAEKLKQLQNSISNN